MNDYNIVDYGAAGDGKDLCTAAIQKAIEDAAATHGRVIVPAGTFLTGTIELRSNVTLELREGAVLLGSPRLGDYRHPIGWGWPHNKKKCDVTPWHLVQALDAENVVIAGNGAIAGNGPAFWYPDRPHEWHFWIHRENRRPSPMVHIEKCRHFRIENVTLRDSAGWTLHLSDCEQARITGVTVRNTYFGPNTDGFDIHNCRGVIVSDCDIATGDDAIALMASQYGGPSEDITISNCILRTSCVGLRIIGFDHDARHRRIAANNLVMPRTSRMFDIRSLNGAVIEHVNLSDCVGTTNSGWPINRPFEVVALAAVHPHGTHLNPKAKRGMVSDIALRNMDITTDGRGMVIAAPPHLVQDISISDVRMRYTMLDDPLTFEQSKAQEAALYLPSTQMGARQARAAIVAENVARLTIRDLSVRWPEYPVPREWFLLNTPWRMLNRKFYRNNEERIRRGKLRVTFKALWARNLKGGRIDLRGLTDSEGGNPAETAGNSDLQVLLDTESRSHA